MESRKRLIELIRYCTSCEKCRDEDIADHLLSNGVKVQDGKPLEAFLHPIDAYKGLKEKYLVFKADTRKKVDNCFVLRPDRDPAATEALRAYANATDNETLAEDIYNWVGKGEPVQQWIPVTERLPETDGWYQVWTKTPFGGFKSFNKASFHNGEWHGGGGRWNNVTHWMPLPSPPEEVAQ